METVPFNRFLNSYHNYLDRLTDQNLGGVRFSAQNVEFYLTTVARQNFFIEDEKQKRDKLKAENERLKGFIENKKHRDKLPAELSQAQKILLQIKSKFKLFDEIADSELLMILKNIRVNKYEKDEVIFAQNDHNDLIYYIVKGSVSVNIKDIEKGTSVKVAELGVKSFFGEMAFINKKPRNATVKTDSDPTILLSFSISEDVEIGTEDIHLKLYKNINKILSAKIEQTNKSLVQKS